MGCVEATHEAAIACQSGVAGRVEATALPPVKAKGKAEELKVYRITGLRKVNTPLPGEWTGPTNH